MPTFLPRDENNNAIPVLRLKSDKAHKIDFSATSARNATAFEASTQVISLYATQDVYLRLGGGSVTATASDHFFPAGVYYDIAIGDDQSGQATHIAAIRDTLDGTLYISEKE
jgi:hypothetical protein